MIASLSESRIFGCGVRNFRAGGDRQTGAAAAFSWRSSAALRVSVCTCHYYCPVLLESERDRDELIVKWSQFFVPGGLWPGLLLPSSAMSAGC
jgi:hypothetical protein